VVPTGNTGTEPTMRSYRLNAAALFLALFTTACASRVPISELLADPGHYDGKTVKTEGQVTQSAGLLGYATYQISDGSRSLTVVTKSGGAPRDGTRVDVEGVFRSAFTLGTRSLSVLEEKKRDPKP
jgi:hypothetical protein